MNVNYPKNSFGLCQSDNSFFLENNLNQTNLNHHPIECIKKYSHYDKKLLVNRIDMIKNKKCNIEIYKIINDNNVKYTQNNNGIFFNLGGLEDDALYKIENVINIFENKKTLMSDNSENIPIYSKIDCDYSDSSDVKNNDDGVIITRQKKSVSKI